jgi:hypothetical protein
MSGYSPRPLVRKLGIGPGDAVAVLEDPGHARTLLSGLPEGATVEIEPPIPASAVGEGDRDVVLLFCRDGATLVRRLDDGIALIPWAGKLWICWPKGSSPLATELNREGVRNRVLGATGLVDTKVCAVDDDGSGLRFVHRKENRPGGAAGRGR